MDDPRQVTSTALSRVSSPSDEFKFPMGSASRTSFKISRRPSGCSSQSHSHGHSYSQSYYHNNAHSAITPLSASLPYQPAMIPTAAQADQRIVVRRAAPNLMNIASLLSDDSDSSASEIASRRRVSAHLVRSPVSVAADRQLISSSQPFSADLAPTSNWSSLNQLAVQETSPAFRPSPAGQVNLLAAVGVADGDPHSRSLLAPLSRPCNVAEMLPPSQVHLRGPLDNVSSEARRKVKAKQLPPKRREESDNKVNIDCCVCWAVPRNMLFLPCRHLCACEGCSSATCGTALLLSMCPVCRVQINSRIKVFM